MSNVIRMTANKNKHDPDAKKWKHQIEALGDRLVERLIDAIRLADDDADDEGMPAELADCAILGAIVGILVDHTYTRNIIGPDALIKFVEYQIKGTLE
jgi:hypothetical protein